MTLAFRSLVGCCLLVLLLPGQSEEGSRRRVIELPPREGPSCVHLRGEAANGPCLVRWNGRRLGVLEARPEDLGPPELWIGRPAAAPQGPADRLELVVAGGSGTDFPEVEVVAGTRLDVRLTDGPDGGLRAGVVEIVAWEGRAPPRLAPSRELGLAHPGPALVLPRGRGRVIVPSGPTMTLVAFSAPTRAVARERVTPPPGGRLEIGLALGPDLAPTGSRWLRPDGTPVPDRRVARALGLGRPFLDAAPLELPEGDLAGAAADLLAPGAGPFVIRPPRGPGGIYAGRHAPATFVRTGSPPLHTNGPVIELSAWIRDAARKRVVGTLRIRHGEDVEGPFRLLVVGEDGPLLDLERERLDEEALVVRARRGAPLLVGIRARRFRGVSLLAPAPAAWIRVSAP